MAAVRHGREALVVCSDYPMGAAISTYLPFNLRVDCQLRTLVLCLPYRLHKIEYLLYIITLLNLSTLNYSVYPYIGNY